MIALSKPPAWPGGGVLSVNKVSDQALPPFNTRTAKIQTNQNRPNTNAAIDKDNMTVFRMLRRLYTQLLE
jgi:hypothetical protein